MNGADVIAGLRKKYALLRGAETLLMGVGLGAFLWTILYVLTGRNDLATPFAILGACLVIAIRARQLRLFQLSNERIAFFLDREFAELKDSTDLLLKNSSEFSGLEEIQAGRTSKALASLMKVTLPHQIPQSAIVLAAGSLLAFGAATYAPDPEAAVPSQPKMEDAEPAPLGEPVEIASHQLIVQPPGYTGLKQSRSQHLTARVPEGSNVTWQIDFTGPPDHAALHFTNGDSLLLIISNHRATGSRRLSESAIYNIKWAGPEGILTSDYFELGVKADEPPSVQIRSLEQFTRLKWGERSHVDVPVFLHDDFGLTQGHIIATVSKGSGESIKFREEKLPFEKPKTISGMDTNASLKINFHSLGMEPGDEVYFYAEALDNKSPDPQRNRTETYFIALQDTASQVITTDASLGVDLMPDYFRSQRQIIIDTEKLLKDQPRISKQAFNSTSNELGYDQKVLRLKYGQFLGEEFETTIGEPAQNTEAEDKDDEEQDPAKKYGHQHDKDNEHNLVAEKKPGDGHDHEEGEEEDITEAYKHNHDNMEEATFFTISVRTKLKMALSLMWDSELQLRLFAPRESLPIQYKILNLLREISQDSRIYVHRMGFDPPPLKEDRRLTGDLDEISNPKATSMAKVEDNHPAIRAALPAIQLALQQTPPAVDDNLKTKLEDAAKEIAAASLERPGDYLIQLSQIRAIIDGTLDPSELPHVLTDIQSVCWNILPPTKAGPHQEEGMRHSLDSKLLEELKKPVNE